MSVKGEIEWITESIVELTNANEGAERRIRDWLDGLVYNARNETRMDIVSIVKEDNDETIRRIGELRWLS